MPPKKQRNLPLPTAHPGKGMPKEQWDACVKMLTDAYNTKEGSRYICEIFRELPDKELFPDYYDAIPEPECLDNIAAKLSGPNYPNPEAFYRQIHLVFLNAMHYNEEGSRVYRDAKRLEGLIEAAWKAAASAGVFANADPYAKPAKKTTVKLVAPGNSATPKTPAAAPTQAASATPAPAPRPTPTPAPAAAPSPAPAPTQIKLAVPKPTPSPAPPAASVPAKAATPIKAPSPLPPVPSLPAAAPAPLPPPSQPSPQVIADRAVMSALDPALPRWPGPQAVLPGGPIEGIPGSGWWGEADHISNIGPSDRMRGVLNTIENYRHDGIRLAEVFDLIPSVVAIPYLSFSGPLTFSAIKINANANRYRTLRDVDMDMTRLFEKARRFFAEGSTNYGKVLILQRLYNALTAPYPLLPPVKQSATLFSSIPAGPGNARSQHETNQDLRAGAPEQEVGHGITTFRVGTKDRVWTTEARHKGMAYRVGDFVHLINPDDAAKPIVGQVFKAFVPTKGQRTHHLTVCWYYRPEQTIHTADRTFFDREVFKTSHLCDHPVEDVLERVSAQFYVKWIRGKSKAPEYFPGWPNYICHSRYNDKLWSTVRIKNWNSCIPEELRQTDFMAVVNYERQVEPEVLPSPFLRGVTGPGFFGEPKGKATEEDDEEPQKPRVASQPVAPPPAAAARTSNAPAPSATPVPRAVPPMTHAPATTAAPYPTQGPQSTPSYPGHPTQSYPQQTPHAPPGQPPATHNRPPITGWNAAPSIATPQNARSLGTIFGGSQILDQVAQKDILPGSTVRLFERDARNQVLWFSGPPLAPGMIPVPQAPGHSLEYLEYLAKRKRGGVNDDAVEGARKVAKRRKNVQGDDEVWPEAETWWTEGMSPEQVDEALRAVVRG